MTNTPRSLRERLEAKRRRRITHHVLVDNPEPLQEELTANRRAQAAAVLNSDVCPDELDELRQREAELVTALADCVVQVEFQALAPGDFEALVAEHTIPDPADGAAVDSGALLPVLAAHCAVDESLRDEQWWTEILAQDVWTSAEKSTLYYRLFNELNYALPPATLGKG